MKNLFVFMCASGATINGLGAMRHWLNGETNDLALNLFGMMLCLILFVNFCHKK